MERTLELRKRPAAGRHTLNLSPALRDAEEVLHERLMVVDVRRHDSVRLRDRRTD
jgi:hypothetical protein